MIKTANAKPAPKAKAKPPKVDKPKVEFTPAPTGPTTLPLWQIRSGHDDNEVTINVRQIGRGEGIAGLAASIETHGLIQPLLVRQLAHENFQVVDGNRRFTALLDMRSRDVIPHDFPVPVLVRDLSDEYARERSLAANVVRLQMHGADEVEAFLRLAQQGLNTAEIANRFGILESQVVQRLALASVAPEVMAAWRAGQITLEHVKAFTLRDDHDRHRELLETVLKSHKTAWSYEPRWIREQITDEAVPTTDRRVRMIGGIEVYTEAGGTITSDLFGDKAWIEDVALLDKLADQKIAAVIAEVRAEGWKEVLTDHPSWWWSRDRIKSSEAPPEPEELVTLRDEVQKLEDECEGFYQDEGVETDDDGDPILTPEQKALEDKIQQLQMRIRTLEAEHAKATAEVQFTAADKASAMACVKVGYNGEIEIERGFREPAPREGDSGGFGSKPKVAPEEADLSQAMRDDLQRVMTNALQHAALDNQRVTLAMLAATMAHKAHSLGGGTQPMRITLTQPATSQDAGIVEKRSALPQGSYAELLEMFLSGSPKASIDAIAACAALVIDVTGITSTWQGALQDADVKAVRNALAPDVRKTWTPTVENFFGRVGKSVILDAIKDMGGTADASGKKADLAATAAALAAESNWLPPALRTSTYAGPKA